MEGTAGPGTQMELPSMGDWYYSAGTIIQTGSITCQMVTTSCLSARRKQKDRLGFLLAGEPVVREAPLNPHGTTDSIQASNIENETK